MRIRDELIEKRKQQINASGYKSYMNANHMCAILDTCGNPLIYGTNIYNIRTPTTEHAEAQAMRKFLEKYSYYEKRKYKVDILVVRTNGHNSKPCDRCIKEMANLRGKLQIRNVYYTHEDEIQGIRCVKFCKLVEDPERHYSSYDRNVTRRCNPKNLADLSNANKENREFKKNNLCSVY
jgi:cytidine deaminase